MLKKSLKPSVWGLFFLSLILFSGCKTTSYSPSSYALNENIIVYALEDEDKEVNDFIQPYKNHLDAEMRKVLSFASQTMDKNQGYWETTIGNLLTASAMEIVAPIFYQRKGEVIDLCMFNHGGIRAVISKGEVTTRTAYEVMPFENEAVVLKLSAENIRGLAEYFIDKKRAHPLSNIQIEINQNYEIQQIMINGKPLEDKRYYYVLTSDYLANGGDQMSFFMQAVERTNMDYKLRNVLIDYFSKHDTLPIIKNYPVIKKP